MKKERVVAVIMMLAFLCFAASLPNNSRSISTDYEHSETHNGNTFTSVRNATLSTGQKIILLVNTTGATWPHLVVDVRGSGEGYVQVWEGTTVSAVGTAMEETNHNRTTLEKKSATVEITHTPTLTSAGDHLNGLDLHFGNGQNMGGESRGAVEIVLETDTLYLINTVSEANSNDTTTRLRWYTSSDYY